MPAVSDSKFLVMAGWDDVPHLTAKAKRELLDSTPMHLRAARSKGIPVLGSGLVFAVDEESILVEPFRVPDHWVRIGGMDFGWDHPWAMVECAWDRDTDTFYVLRDARQRETTPRSAWNTYEDSWDLKWLPFSWPHDGLQHDKGSGEQLASQYKAAGFNMLEERATFPESEGGGNGLEAGISGMLDLMGAGRWKVFKTCQFWIGEFRMYHRKDGLIVKANDDTISASRYAWMMRRFARRKPTGQKVKIAKGWKSA